jgi:hypothetical protein
MLQSAAIGAINQFGSKSAKNNFNKYVDKLKKPNTIETYGNGLTIDAVTNKIKPTTLKYSEFISSILFISNSSWK